MSKLTWDDTGAKYYETGDDHGILYVLAGTGDTKPEQPTMPTGYSTVAQSNYMAGVAWNGLTAVTEQPSGADETELWADNDKYASFRAAEKFGATVECYTYPKEFELCDGAVLSSGVRVAQQTRRHFGFYFRSKVGNDQGIEKFKHHIIYDLTASPSERAYATVNDSPDAITFSYEMASTPVTIGGTGALAGKKTSILTIDESQLTEQQAANLLVLRDVLEGSTNNTPQLPSPEDVLAIMAYTPAAG